MKRHNNDDYIYDMLDDLELGNMEEINNYESDIKADKIKIEVLSKIKSSEHNEQKDSISKKHKTIFQKFKKSTIVAAVFFLAIIGSFTSSQISRANKIENNTTIEAYGIEINKDALMKYSTKVDQTISDKDIDIKIGNVLIDGNAIWFDYEISSKKFHFKDNQWTQGQEMDNVFSFDIKLNDKETKNKGGGSTGGVIDKNTLQINRTIDIRDMNLKGNVKVDFSCTQIGNEKGNWSTSFNVEAKDILEETKEYKVGKIFKLGNSIYRISSIVVDPIQTSVYYASFGGNKGMIDLKLSNENKQETSSISGGYEGKFLMGEGFARYSSANVIGDKLIITPEIPIRDGNGEIVKSIKAKEIIINLNK